MSLEEIEAAFGYTKGEAGKSVTTKEQIERIAELQNEIESIMDDLKSQHQVEVLSLYMDTCGRKYIQLSGESTLSEMYPESELKDHNVIYNKRLVEVEGVEVFAFKRKQMEGETV